MAVKNLILIRHSYANSQSEIGDVGRVLSEQGKAKIRSQIAKLDLLPKVDFVHVSHAKRTMQTFEMLNEYFKVKDDKAWVSNEIYNGSYLDYMQVLSLSPAEVNTIAFIAHNPSISYLASKLCTDFNHGFNPGDILWLQADLENWEVINAKWDLKMFLSE